MILYILGNGFDRAHNMETSYNCFEEFVRKNHYDKKISYDSQYECYNLWSNFEENLAKLDRSSLLTGNEGMFELSEDANYTLDASKDGWFTDVIRSRLVCAAELKSIFEEWIESIEIPTDDSERRYDLSRNQEDLFINFNYTTTLEKLYKIKDDNILYIHGCYEKIGKNIIVGHGAPHFYAKRPVEFDENGEEVEVPGIDLSDEGTNSKEDRIMIECIAEYLNELKKPTNEISRELINFLNSHLFLKKVKEISKICVFGHSCGTVDIPYFLSIQNYIGNDIEWEITYYSDKEVKDMEQRLINGGLCMKNIKFICGQSVSYKLDREGVDFIQIKLI